ncbi:hypothetical protein HHK36_020627 [Tetracentron sinense]|uniref:Phytocyanin domain-containing protein n=1 Tax=Tetracentron sinense TaxID=13715 RepID=A0A834YRY4_TETSI|nr:hypothetical protein HHK36_020627 [Tetracentron sinense]
MVLSKGLKSVFIQTTCINVPELAVVVAAVDVTAFGLAIVVAAIGYIRVVDFAEIRSQYPEHWTDGAACPSIFGICHCLLLCEENDETPLSLLCILSLRPKLRTSLCISGLAMALLKSAIIFFLGMAALQVSIATVYKVGDSAGWTFLDANAYDKWAASKKFLVGDIINFEYDSGFHNVLQVSQADFKSCNAANPLATYTTGNDSITVEKLGHYYFLCGIPMHCEQGMKVDIRVNPVA